MTALSHPGPDDYRDALAALRAVRDHDDEGLAAILDNANGAQVAVVLAGALGQTLDRLADHESVTGWLGTAQRHLATLEDG